MEIWFVAEANNNNYNIEMSPGFNTKEEAERYLNDAYEDILANVEGNIEEKSLSDDSFQVMTFGCDLYYGQIHKITI